VAGGSGVVAGCNRTSNRSRVGKAPGRPIRRGTARWRGRKCTSGLRPGECPGSPCGRHRRRSVRRPGRDHRRHRRHTPRAEAGVCPAVASHSDQPRSRLAGRGLFVLRRKLGRWLLDRPACADQGGPDREEEDRGWVAASRSRSCTRLCSAPKRLSSASTSRRAPAHRWPTALRRQRARGPAPDHPCR